MNQDYIQVLQKAKEQYTRGEKIDVKKASKELKSDPKFRDAEQIAKNKMVISISKFHFLAQTLREAIDDLPSNCKLNYENIRKATDLIMSDMSVNDDILYIPSETTSRAKKMANGSLENTMQAITIFDKFATCQMLLKDAELDELNDLITDFFEKKKVIDKDGNINWLVKSI